MIGTFSSVSALSLEDLLDSEQVEALQLGETIMHAQFGSPEAALLPSYESLQRYVTEQRSALQPSIMVEALSLYRKTASAVRGSWSAGERAAIFNRLLAISSLQGLEYYSASRGVMRTLYEMSHVIDSPTAKRPIPDPEFSELPAEFSLYARQRDLTFGDNIYRYDFHTTEHALIFTQQNLTSLNVGIIPAIGKEKLRSTFAVFDTGNYLLVYVVSMAKAASLPGMRDRVGNSFSTRAQAVIAWFSNQAEEAFAETR